MGRSVSSLMWLPAYWDASALYINHHACAAASTGVSELDEKRALARAAAAPARMGAPDEIGVVVLVGAGAMAFFASLSLVAVLLAAMDMAELARRLDF